MLRISSKMIYSTLVFSNLISVIVITSNLSDDDFQLGKCDFTQKSPKNNSLIIVITPTYSRLTQLADMTRMANTLMHISDLYWIVIEDGNLKNEKIDNLLRRSKIPHSYLPFKTETGYPKRGWYQRTMALTLLRNNQFHFINKKNQNAVVYFGDDDNSYDIRVFTEYIRNVKRLGMWAVGHAGGAIAEKLIVNDGKVTDFDVAWGESREFAVDMAGFAIHLDIVHRTNATFGPDCGPRTPETCLLEEMHFKRDDIEPFGVEKNVTREIYVWHTQTIQPFIHVPTNETTTFKRVLNFLRFQ